jgi:hypothetical protein
MNDFLQRQFINQSQSAAGLWTLDKPNSQLLNSGRGASPSNQIRPKMNFILACLTQPEPRSPSSNAVHQALSDQSQAILPACIRKYRAQAIKKPPTPNVFIVFTLIFPAKKTVKNDHKQIILPSPLSGQRIQKP